MELLLRVKMTKQHDGTTRRYYNDLFDRFTWKNYSCALKWQNNMMLQHDVITTTCLIEIAICALKKQSDVTTSRYDNNLFAFYP